MAHNCLKILRRPLTIAEHEYSISASIGISCYPEHGTEPELLQQNADTAMYHAKFNGKNGFQVFTPEINAHLHERLELMGDLRHAMENGELHLEYQPQFIADGQMVGFEALLRWNHPKRGMIFPDKFIPIAEETGLIVPVGNWVLNQACRQLAVWHKSGYPNLRVAVNVSTLQFERQDWMDTISDALKKSGVPPSCLELELTESVVMKNCGRAASRLTELRALGVSSAIDDFGTGYSSLKYLQNLPIDTLKIDQSFIRNLDPASDGQSGNGAIVQAIVTLAQQLGLRVVAEGVETDEELQVLRRLGCDFVQGYLFLVPCLWRNATSSCAQAPPGRRTGHLHFQACELAARPNSAIWCRQESATPSIVLLSHEGRKLRTARFASHETMHAHAQNRVARLLSETWSCKLTAISSRTGSSIRRGRSTFTAIWSRAAGCFPRRCSLACNITC